MPMHGIHMHEVQPSPSLRHVPLLLASPCIHTCRQKGCRAEAIEFIVGADTLESCYAQSFITEVEL